MALGLSLVVRWLLRGPSGEPILDAELDGRGKGLDVYEAAYLAGGPMRVVNAGLAALSQRGQLEVDFHGRKFKLVAHRPPMANALEARLGLAIGVSGTEVKDLRRRAGAIAKEVRKGLVNRGMILSHSSARAVRRLSALPVLAVLGVGLVKALIGLSRGRPVSYLVLLCVLTGVIGRILLVKRPFRSRRGDRGARHPQARERGHDPYSESRVRVGPPGGAGDRHGGRSAGHDGTCLGSARRHSATPGP